jgi:hypothetical protein
VIRRHPWFVRFGSFLLAFGIPVAASLALNRAATREVRIKFFDAPSQAAEFIGYSRSIALTPAQRKVRDAALDAMAAPCCKDFRLATCCCPCNLAKGAWGLASYLIVRQGATPAEVRKTVGGWLAFVNPAGFSGNACNTAGGCARRFSEDGCGGMDERNFVAAR